MRQELARLTEDALVALAEHDAFAFDEACYWILRHDAQRIAWALFLASRPHVARMPLVQQAPRYAIWRHCRLTSLAHARI